MTKTRKLKGPVVQSPRPPEPALPEPPPPDDEAVEAAQSQGPAPAPEPAATPSAPPAGDAAAEAEAAGPAPEKIDLSSPMAEFGLRIGSLAEARRSMMLGYLGMVVAPTVILLLFISLLDGSGSDGAANLISAMERMLMVVAAMGLPVMVVSWANGLYPKGSYGRFASGSSFAVLLAVWFVLLLLESDLQEAVADYGPVLQLDRVLVLACLTSAFYFVHAASEFIGCRSAWRKSVGAEVKVATIDLESGFLDFDLHIGKLQGGSSSALKAYARFLVVPTVVLVVADWVIGGMDLAAKDVLQASVGSMFGIVLLFGAVMVVIGFVRGFYPSGSLGRTIPGLLGVSVLSLYAWMILLDSGIEDAFGRNHFVIDMHAVLLPVLMYVMFMAVFELSELVDNRRGWHKGLGVPVRPCLPEEEYRCFHDFCCRYASFVAGSKKGRKVVNKYAFRRILVVIVLEAVVVSAYQYSGSAELRDFIGLMLSDQTLSSHIRQQTL